MYCLKHSCIPSLSGQTNALKSQDLGEADGTDGFDGSRPRTVVAGMPKNDAIDLWEQLRGTIGDLGSSSIDRVAMGIKLFIKEDYCS